ncbi:MAG: hypothetical protein E7399_09020 [Ruminococcaceae bacterium]|nr:hypothetical protein [Oscillospiraceae bacterium]
MLCSKCGKHPATIHYQENINGKKAEYDLCEACANQMKLTEFSGFSLDPLWMTPKLFREETDACPFCGLTLREFSKGAKFGCAECYNAFSRHVPSLLKRIHGHTKHTGKIPKRAGKALRTENKIEELKTEMNRAVLEQNFELAAHLRDQIKELEGKQ